MVFYKNDYNKNGEYETLIFLESNAEKEKAIANKTIVDNQASVPIVVYQKLLEELKETQGKLEIIKQENQQLALQNTWLKEEIQKVFFQTEKIKQFINLNDGNGANETKENNKENIDKTDKKTAEKTELPLTENLELTPTLNNLETKPGLVNSWLLALAMIAIIITTFGMGLLLLSFSLDNNHN